MTKLLCFMSLAALTMGAGELAAQACHGAPAPYTIAAEVGDRALGSIAGASVNGAGGRFAWNVGYRRHKVDREFGGHEGLVRASYQFPVRRLVVCPTLRLGYLRETWDVDSDLSLTANTLTIGGGVAAGMELRVLSDNLHLMPLFAMRYEFSGGALQLDVPDSEDEITPDTVSGVSLEYGLVVRFYNFTLGRVIERRTANPAPHLTRWFAGYTIGGRRSGAR